MPKRIRKFQMPLDVTSFGLLFAGEGEMGGGGGGGGKPAGDTTEPNGDKPSDDAGDDEKDAAAGRGDGDWKGRFEGQQKVNRDLETKLNQLRDGLKGALGVEDKKADVTDLVGQLQQQLDSLTHDNLVNDVARRHKISDDDDMKVLRAVKDRDLMETLAARLAPKGDEGGAGNTSGKPGSKPKPDSSQGRGGGSDTGSRPSSVAEVMEQRRIEREKRQTSKSS